MVLSTKIWKYKPSVKLHWNEPAAMRLAFITKGTYLFTSEKRIIFIVDRSNYKNSKTKKMIKINKIKNK